MMMFGTSLGLGLLVRAERQAFEVVQTFLVSPLSFLSSVVAGMSYEIV
jgi:hypothetical protein